MNLVRLITATLVALVPAVAFAGDSSWVTNRESAAGLTRVNNNDGTFHYALPQGASTSDVTGTQLTWHYLGQADYAYDYTPWGATVSTEDGVQGSDDSTHGRSLISGMIKVDNIGRKWEVSSVNTNALDSSVADYESDMDSEFGAESISEGSASAGAADGSDTYTITPSSFAFTDCNSDGDWDMAVEGGSESRSAWSDTSNGPNDATATIYRDQSPMCSGTFLHDGFVLTALHCIMDGAGEIESNLRFDVCTRGNRLSGATCTTVAFSAFTAAGLSTLGDGDILSGDIKNDWALLKMTTDIAAHHRALSKATSGDLSPSTVTNAAYPQRIGGSSCTNQHGTASSVVSGFPTAIGVAQGAASVTGTAKKTVKSNLDSSGGASGSPMYFTSGSTIRVAGVMSVIVDGILDNWTGGPRVSEFRDTAVSVMTD